MTLDHAARVLLVEDNPLDARRIRRSLSGAEPPVDVVHVETLADALDVAVNNAVDAILLDLSLPDSDGLDSLARLLESVPATPVIVLTGLDDPQVAVTAVETGAQDFLSKGTITPELVERALRYAIARHHAEIELRAASAQLDSLQTREQIARDLHDTVIQRLFAIGMSLQAGMGLGDADELRARIGRAVDEIDGSIHELRQAIFGLHGAPTPEGASTRTLVDRICEIVARHEAAGLGGDYDVPASLPLSEDAEHDLLAIIEEAVSNSVQHGKASTIEFIADVDDHTVKLSIVDDGSGVHGTVVVGVEGAGLRGRGLTNMAVRAERHGGHCLVQPDPAGGTRVELEFPRSS